MANVEIKDKGIILLPEFFKDSELVFSWGNSSWQNSVYELLSNKYFLRKELLFDRGEKLFGEVESIFVDSKLNPHLNYSTINFFDGKKQYGKREQLPLSISKPWNPYENLRINWLAFLAGNDFRRKTPMFALHLPKRFYLEEQLS